MKNLKFIPKEVPWFGISMVVQDANYREIPKFIELRDKLVKESGNKNIYVYFAKITNWGTFTDKEYEKKAVWKESHPNYNDLVKILNENVKKSFFQKKSRIPKYMQSYEISFWEIKTDTLGHLLKQHYFWKN